MTLICQCDHSRKEHLGGVDFLNDSRVKRCQHDGCSCKGYSPDKTTRDRKSEIRLASYTIPGVIAGLCVATFLLANFATDAVLADYIIDRPFETKKFFANGTEVPKSNPSFVEPITPKDQVAFFVKYMIFMIVAMGGVLGSMIFSINYYETHYWKLIREENV